MHAKLGSIALDSGAPLHGQSQRFWQRRRHALARQMWNILDNTTGRHLLLLCCIAVASQVAPALAERLVLQELDSGRRVSL